MALLSRLCTLSISFFGTEANEGNEELSRHIASRTSGLNVDSSVAAGCVAHCQELGRSSSDYHVTLASTSSLPSFPSVQNQTATTAKKPEFPEFPDQ